MDLVNVHHATVLCILSTQVSGYVNLRYELVVSKWFQSVKTGAGHLNFVEKVFCVFYRR